MPFSQSRLVPIIEDPKKISPETSWQIKLLYDGLCPLCLREVAFLTKRDAGQGIIAFIDIADLTYQPELHGGVDFATAMGRIHAVLPDGTVLQGVEVFRRIYEALGIGWIYAATQWPVIGPLVDWTYDIWANWRLKLTGRPDLATLVTQRENLLENRVENRCKLDA
jgi:predicted DCC family thiol-disulfide oxidoreductase YuxK